MEEKLVHPQAQQCLQQLMRVWFDFERRLNRVPIINRLETGHFTVEDYRELLLNLRQQVIEGSRWISRGASSFDRHFSDVRSIVIAHATEEHKDYTILENDFVAAGGDIKEIIQRERNLGSEALHAFLMYKATQANPISLIGAMWIIEGLGQKMAVNWADRIEQLTKPYNNHLNFLRYHGENDDSHMAKLYKLLDRVCQSEKDTRVIVKTARVVARLYAMQLDEIDEQ
ncbi:3-oxoacyl-[acyl-carrier-protein] synthase-3 [Alteromonadaceae bacterium Bs31]|nr:3-oxoacyl-[acyl-carrier-protein] synthase-3 [Alteromonadaceae bacterium Bs31]